MKITSSVLPQHANLNELKQCQWRCPPPVTSVPASSCWPLLRTSDVELIATCKLNTGNTFKKMQKTGSQQDFLIMLVMSRSTPYYLVMFTTFEHKVLVCKYLLDKNTSCITFSLKTNWNIFFHFLFMFRFVSMCGISSPTAEKRIKCYKICMSLLLVIEKFSLCCVCILHAHTHTHTEEKGCLAVHLQQGCPNFFH